MDGPTPPSPLPTEKLRFAMPPMHESVEDERRHRKERLAGALRLFGRLGFDDGVSGHITARDPEFRECFWVNPFGMPFRHVSVSDLVLANRDGQVPLAFPGAPAPSVSDDGGGGPAAGSTRRLGIHPC